MARIDRAGVAMGVVFGIFGQAIYDTFFYLFTGQIQEQWKASVAGLVAAIILLLIFNYFGYFKEKETKKITETK